MRNGKTEYIQYEVDFIANNGTDKYYIQSAFALDDESLAAARTQRAPED